MIDKVAEQLEHCQKKNAEYIEMINRMWTPINDSSDFPEDLQEVLITFVNHDPASYYKNIKDVPQIGVAVYLDYAWYWWTPTTVDFLAEYQNAPNYLLDDALEVTAWMPFPMAYKE